MLKEDYEQLERLVDRLSLSDVLCGLSHVCDEKEQHLRHAWQDHRTAARWHKASCRLACCATSDEILNVDQ